MIEEIVSFVLGAVTGIVLEYLYSRFKNKNNVAQTTTEEKTEEKK
jgi:uncharacterized membrane-anchored protein YhcB (DUF1043 family)